MSAKGPGNTFKLSPKWARTLTSLIYFSWGALHISHEKYIKDRKVLAHLEF
jgi:hypothetical protein